MRIANKCLHTTRRFAAMAGVARRTITAEIHRYCLVASVLRPATAASRWTLAARQTAQWVFETSYYTEKQLSEQKALTTGAFWK
jgi:hypothetical protein